MKILGIDPGLNITGYGLLDCGKGEERIIEAGVIRTKRNAAMEDRLKELADGLGDIINQLRPDAAAVEDLYSHYDHPKTAIIMGHARGIVFLKAAEAGIPVYPYASTRIKNSLTGNGRASKRQMQMMIVSTFGMREIPEPPDIADALAVALCHSRVEAQKATVAG